MAAHATWEVKNMFATKTLEHDKKILEQGIKETAVKMLKEDAEISFVSRITGMTEERLIELKRNIGK